jgi:hypothetical protein
MEKDLPSTSVKPLGGEEPTEASVSADPDAECPEGFKHTPKRTVRKKCKRYLDIMAEAKSPSMPALDAAKTNLTTQMSESGLVGLRVRVCAKKDLFDGRVGIVVSYEEAAELYVVHLDGSKEELIIKGSKLELL